MKTLKQWRGEHSVFNRFLLTIGLFFASIMIFVFYEFYSTSNTQAATVNVTYTSDHTVVISVGP
jgi:hypothetical protein